MVAFLLMLPVASTLVWIYWYFLPTDSNRTGRWRWVDTGLLLVLFVLACLFVYTRMFAGFINASPIWAEIVAATGAYLIIATGLSIGLIVRRRSARTK